MFTLFSWNLAELESIRRGEPMRGELIAGGNAREIISGMKKPGERDFIFARSGALSFVGAASISF